MALVWGQTLAIFEIDYFCCMAGESAEETVVAAADVVVVVDLKKPWMAKLLLAQHR